jgi:hypothetical protein
LVVVKSLIIELTITVSRQTITAELRDFANVDLASKILREIHHSVLTET